MASLSFDATSIDTTSHEPIKAGTYEAVITASEIKANRANTGKGLNLTFEIISDSAKGRKVWAWINFQHQKQEANIPRAEGELAKRGAMRGADRSGGTGSCVQGGGRLAAHGLRTAS